METLAHQHLKCLAHRFLRARGCQAVATEVSCPISRYRVDVAGYFDTIAAPEAEPGRRRRCELRTFVIECKQCRGDFLRDSDNAGELLDRRLELDCMRRSIEQNRIRAVEPHLRRSGGSLFAELEQWDFSASRLRSYRDVLRKLRRIDAQLHGQTKFFMIARYCLADQLYLAAPRGMIRRRELPPGWGLLECPPQNLLRHPENDPCDERSVLTVRVEAPLHTTKPAHRLRMLRNIAVSASWSAQRLSEALEASALCPLVER